MKNKDKIPKYGHKSQTSAFNGVLIYIYNNYPSIIEGNKASKYQNQCHDIIKHYLSIRGINHEVSINNRHKNANKVQNNWQDFKEFMSSEYKNNN